MDDIALNYEYLIRRAHQCGRYGVQGSDADTFRRLQRHAHMYFFEKESSKKGTERLTNQKIEDLLSKYLISAGEDELIREEQEKSSH